MALVLVGGTLIDGTGRDPIPNAVVIIEGERIRSVGSAVATQVPSGSTTLDLTGHTILPGMINAHVHLAWDGAADLVRQATEDSPAMAAMRAARNLQRSLDAGVTTVRDLGCAHGVALAARDAVVRGLLPGPRVVASGAPLSITGGHGHVICREVDGADAVLAAVRAEIKQGADVIKLMATGGVNSPNEEPGGAQMTAEEIRAAVTEARRTHRRVAVHAMGFEGIRDSVRAGVTSVEHGGQVDDETVALMVQQGIYLVPTFSPCQLQADRGADIGMPEYALQKARGVIASDRDEHLRRMADAGVKVVMGTDAGGPCVYHDDIVTELRLMMETGLCRTAMDVIVASTRHGAEVLGWESQLGTLEPGKLADILVVRGDPLANIDAMRCVEFVFKGGGRMPTTGAAGEVNA